MMLLKITLFYVFGVYTVKTCYFPHTVHYCCSVFLKHVDYYEAHRSEEHAVL